MKATRFFRIFTTLALVLSLASPGFAIDATLTPRTEITPKSPIPTGTVATWPLDAAVPPGWLACNGQAVPSSYPELRALMGSVPNYNSRQFLRGATSGAGSSVADSTRSHIHVVPSHSHTVSGTASAHAVSVGGLAVSGTAAGQQYVDTRIMWTQHDTINNVTPGPDPIYSTYSYIYTDQVQSYSKTAAASSVSGTTSTKNFTTSGGSITGVTNAVGQTTESTGGSETAPMHMLVKYIIKAD